MSWNSGALLAGVLAGLALVGPTQAAERALNATLVPELRWSNASSPFRQSIPGFDFGRNRVRADLEGQWRSAGLNFLATARVSLQEGQPSELTGILNETYWDGAVFDQRFTVGKKIVSWDVGLGFRPLDVLQRDDRRVLYASTYEGIPSIAWERFGKAAAWTIVYANPGAGTNQTARDDESIAARYYHHVHNADLYLIARHSERHGFEGGPAVSYVAGDGLELHGSLRYQQRLVRVLNREAEASPGDEPFEQVVERDTLTALVGATWTHAGGTSVLGEWWFDPAAHGADEWRRVLRLADWHAAQLQSGDLPAATAVTLLDRDMQYFNQPNLLRHNVLLRISHQRETLQRSFDVLWTPEDGGLVATLAVAYGWNQLRVSAGLRIFGGARGAAYRALPDEQVMFCAVGMSW